jgi:hypothetical protein
MKKFFVISLPRTGTKSMCKMAKICGLKIKHVPTFRYESYLNNHDFFADTPCFVPSFVEKMCQDQSFDSNFIYIEKDHKEIFNSWAKVNLYKNYVWLYNNYMNEESKTKMGVSMIKDIESYQESLSYQFMTQENYSELFSQHKNQVTDIIKKYNEKILFYNFSEGWEPFCGFIESETPNTKIPYLNKDTMFEKVD